jgi:hypothetical protein
MTTAVAVATMKAAQVTAPRPIPNRHTGQTLPAPARLSNMEPQLSNQHTPNLYWRPRPAFCSRGFHRC